MNSIAEAEGREAEAAAKKKKQSSQNLGSEMMMIAMIIL